MRENVLSLIRELEGNRRLGIFQCRCEDNTKFDVRKLRYVDVDFFHLAQDRNRWWIIVNMVNNLHFNANGRLLGLIFEISDEFINICCWVLLNSL